MVSEFDYSIVNNRGFLSYLFAIGKGSLIEINASSCIDDYYLPKYAIDGNSQTRYGSVVKSGYGQYFQIHLKQSRFKIHGYSLQYVNDKANYPCYPKNWNLRAGNNPDALVDIDTQRENDQCADEKIGYFEISPDNQMDFSYFRIVNMGKNGYGDSSLYISQFEIYGTVVEDICGLKTCQHKTNINTIAISLLSMPSLS